MTRADFVNLLRSVAAKHGLDFISLSHDWIIQIRDPRSGRVCSIFGYTFDVNGAGAIEICKEKAATSLVLSQQGVPNINHSVFLNPANEFTAEYVKRTGNWGEVRALVDSIGFPVVLKPLKGTGGFAVTKAKCWRDVEAAVQHLFGKEYGLAVSPYKHIVDEYRCVCFDGKPELTYRKVRSHVVGDGTSSMAALIASNMAAAEPSAAAAIAKAGAELSTEDWARVPGKGEEAPLQWKHNLGLGAGIDLKVGPEKKRAVEEIALAAAKAIGVCFCSVDVAEVKVEDKGETLMIMEVNGGVMMDSLIGLLGEDGKALATRLYETAVLASLDVGQSSGSRKRVKLGEDGKDQGEENEKS